MQPIVPPKDGHQFHNTRALCFLKERFLNEDRTRERYLEDPGLYAKRDSNVFFLDSARRKEWKDEIFTEGRKKGATEYAHMCRTATGFAPGPSARGAYRDETGRTMENTARSSLRGTARTNRMASVRSDTDSVKELQTRKLEIESQLYELDQVLNLKVRAHVHAGESSPARPFAMFPPSSRPEAHSRQPTGRWTMASVQEGSSAR